MYSSNFPPGLRYHLINRIGQDIYNKSSIPIRKIMIEEEFEKFKQSIILKYGSNSNYQRCWLRKKKLRKIDYETILAKNRGFNNYKEYQDSLYIKKGFKNKDDNDRFKRLRKKYHRSVSDFTVREIQLKKELKKEIEKFIFVRKNDKRLYLK